MPQTVCVIVSASDRQRLEAIAADRNRSRKYVERAQVVLAAAQGDPVPAPARVWTKPGLQAVWHLFPPQEVDSGTADRRKPSARTIPSRVLSSGFPFGLSVRYRVSRESPVARAI